MLHKFKLSESGKIEISRDFVVWTHHHLKWSEKTTQIVRLNKTKFNYYVITMIEHKLYYHARKLGTKILRMVNGYHLVKIWHCLKLAHILSKTLEVLNYLGICNYKSLNLFFKYRFESCHTTERHYALLSIQSFIISVLLGIVEWTRDKLLTTKYLSLILKYL